MEIPVERIANDRRGSRRYDLRLMLRWKLMGLQRLLDSGCGVSVDLSSGGVLFDAGAPLPLGLYVELSIAWPVLLHNAVPLQLIVSGPLIRTSGTCAAVQLVQHEFRTIPQADAHSALSAINRLIVAEEGVPVERRYSFPVGIFTREVKAPRSSSDLGKGQRRERGPHGHDTGYLTFPRPGQPRSRLGRGVRGYHSASVPDL